MVKLSLAFVAIMTIGILMGSSMGSVDAAKPTPTTVDECEDREDGVCPIFSNGKCGVETVFGYESRITTTTLWDNNSKIKITSTRTGELYDGNAPYDLVATFDKTITTNGFLEDADKGATVVKLKHKIDCVNGETDFIEHTVTVIHPDKKK
jgi:hypothetical protein